MPAKGIKKYLKYKISLIIRGRHLLARSRRENMMLFAMTITRDGTQLEKCYKNTEREGRDVRAQQLTDVGVDAA